MAVKMPEFDYTANPEATFSDEHLCPCKDDAPPLHIGMHYVCTVEGCPGFRKKIRLAYRNEHEASHEQLGADAIAPRNPAAEPLTTLAEAAAREASPDARPADSM